MLLLFIINFRPNTKPYQHTHIDKIMNYYEIMNYSLQQKMPYNSEINFLEYFLLRLFGLFS